MEKLVLYGAGKRGRELCELLTQCSIAIAGIFDSAPDKWNEKIGAIKIQPPELLPQFFDAQYCITIGNDQISSKIRDGLIHKYHFHPEQEIPYAKLLLEAYKADPELKQALTPHAHIGGSHPAVLFDCPNGLSLGGVQSWTRDICSALIYAGHKDVFILSDQNEYDTPPILQDHIIPVYREHEDIFSKSIIQTQIEIIMSKLPCRVVTSWVNELMLAAYLVKLQYPEMVKIISVIHEGNERVYAAYLEFIECLDLVVGVSQDIKAAMLERGVAEHLVSAMECPFACEETLSRTYSQAGTEPIRIGFAGRLDTASKRTDLLLKLFAVLAKREIAFEVELAGDGPSMTEMERWVQASGLQEKVRFLGSLDRSQISQFWKRQDVCVNLSDSEGRCISIIEAMGNGAVPVVTETSGVREDIENDVNGYIVPIGDYQLAASKIEYLSRHKSRLKEMGKLAHDSVFPKSSMGPHLQLWERFLELL